MPSLAYTSHSLRIPRNLTRAETTPSEANPPSAGTPAAENSVVKAVRAYERERQRTKKAVDWERTRERRERQRNTGGHAARICTRHCRGASGRHSRRMREGNDDERESEGTCGEPHSPDASARSAGSSDEVDIARLIRPAKARKSKLADFEIVPNIPSVIVLDDYTMAEPEMDEPWEHIMVDELEEKAITVEAPSYARVVASAM
ncbi:hypothetical protein A0H81_11539 [Grifola frondosa]|uniref:Uncharacterized protein n=1 Tax=Grifola frondosa TaxID=5627 RepID=A0A1C7LV09_GRIFR|nr:hypothetical protein A0H81_11539 [Grifola frondosa]